MKFSMKKIALGVAATFAIAGASTAYAVPKISIGIQQLGGVIPVVGNLSGTTGVPGTATASYTGAFGTFSSVSVQAKGYPQQSAPDILNSSTIDVSTTTVVPETLNIYVTSIDNVVPAPGSGGLVKFTSFFSLTSMPAGWTLTEQTLVSAGNFAYSGTSLASAVLAPPQAQTFANTFFAPGSLYAITEIYTIHAGGAGNLNAGIDLQGIPAVPEPETYAMMLAGLGLMGFIARRRKKVAVA